VDQTKSKTEKEAYPEESIVGISHYKTTISDGKKSVVGKDVSARESQRIASEKWNKEDS